MMDEKAKALFEHIVTLKAQVGHILEKYKETRNSDDELIVRVAAEFHLDPVHIGRSVIRIRQKFNQKEQFLPTIWEVAKQRKINIDTWRKALGYQSQLF